MTNALPKLFQQLTADDWASIRKLLTRMEPGEQQTVMTSQGYIDLEAGDDEGEGSVTAQSFGHDGKGGLQTRTVWDFDWPAASPETP